MRPPLLIVNPTCGRGAAARTLPDTLATAERALGDLVIRQTAHRGHARELAMQGVREGHPLIVAVGGDGTLSEVVDGVLAAGDALPVEEVTRGDNPDSERAVPAVTRDQTAPVAGRAAPTTLRPTPAGGPAVGLINLGTGGDFSRSLGIAPGLEACVAALASANERLVDVGRAVFRAKDGRRVERYFVNVLSAGLGGLVDHYMETMPAFLGGRTGYYLAALRAVIAGKEQRLLARITWNAETREQIVPAYLVAVCNGRWFGGGMDVAPMALLDDGRLEVLTITERNKIFLGGKIRKVYTGRHLEEPTVHHFPCHRIELRLEDESAESQCLLDLDGDPLGSLPLTVEVVPGRLRVRA